MDSDYLFGIFKLFYKPGDKSWMTFFSELRTHCAIKDREVFTTSGKYPWSFVTQIFHNGHPSHGGDRKTFEVKTST
jgi:hypothetical protein